MCWCRPEIRTIKCYRLNCLPPVKETTTHEILHIIRNPYGWSEDEVRAARLAAADLIEDQAKDVETLNSVSKEMARTGMQIRNDLAESKLKNIEQAKEIEALRKALTEIAEWTDRYTSPGHPVSIVAKRALNRLKGYLVGLRHPPFRVVAEPSTVGNTIQLQTGENHDTFL